MIISMDLFSLSLGLDLFYSISSIRIVKDILLRFRCIYNNNRLIIFVLDLVFWVGRWFWEFVKEGLFY